LWVIDNDSIVYPSLPVGLLQKVISISNIAEEGGTNRAVTPIWHDDDDVAASKVTVASEGG
jgi:hypothetical protein